MEDRERGIMDEENAPAICDYWNALAICDHCHDDVAIEDVEMVYGAALCPGCYKKHEADYIPPWIGRRYAR